MIRSRIHLILPAVLLLLGALFLTLRFVRKDSEAPRDASSATDSKSPSQQRQSSSAGSRPDEDLNTREADRQLEAMGAKTDISLAEFPRNAYQHMPSPGGKPAGTPIGEAYIHVPSSGRRVAVQSNQIGEFPTIEASTNETVGVRLFLDAVKTGTPVRVVIMDGGGFPTAQGNAQVLKTEKGGSLGFEFTVSANFGYHRVLVQAQGHPACILNFNAGDGETWPPRGTASNN